MLRVLSWNIQWGRGADGRVDLARTIAAIRACGELDLICLQEVASRLAGLPGGKGSIEGQGTEGQGTEGFDAEEAEDGLAILSAAFPEFAAIWGPALDLPRVDGARAGFGNLLLSRLPVGQVWRHLLPAPADPLVAGMQRACIEAVVDTVSGPLRVLTTHLEYHSALQRAAQIEALRGLQAEAAAQAVLPPRPPGKTPAFTPWPRPARALLCGDLNCEPHGADHRRLLEPLAAGLPGWRDAWQHSHPGRPHAPTVGLHGAEWPGRRFCCDYFLVSAGLDEQLRSLRVVEATAASDHQPLLLEIDC